MIIHVLSKYDFEQALQISRVTDLNVATRFSHLAFVCICDPENFESGFGSLPYFKEDHANVIRLWFDDVDKEKEELVGMQEVTRKPMSIEQARALLIFLENQREHGVNRIYVHCLAGVARSGAVGTFINDWSDGDKEKFKKTNPKIIPNAAVLRVMHNVWEEKNNLKS